MKISIGYQQLFMLLIVALFIGGPSNAFAGGKKKEIKVKNIKGTAIGGENETIEELRAKAIAEAKVEALREAGIEENIAAFQDLFTSEKDDDFEELFTSDILSDIQGAVKEVEVIHEEKKFNAHGNLEMSVVINCTVVKYKVKKDLTFNFWVEGFEKFYNHESTLNFSVKPAADAYVKVFVITKSESYLLFPNDYQKSFMMQKDQRYNFPSPDLDYVLETEKDEEMHRTILVLLKNDIPYTEEVNYKNITKWIFSIPPDERMIKSFAFNVVKN